MPLRIAQHQRQLRDQVLEVVHDKRRHPVERVELARFEQRLGRADLAEIARRLPARGLQQIADLPVDSIVVRGVISTTKPSSSAPDAQRNDEPRRRKRVDSHAGSASPA